MFSSLARFNDFAPEMLASARRGPFAEPTATERVEYLLTRLRTERTRLDHENYALEHCISYQRRVAATKDAFMRRGKLTPLGILGDWWDRIAHACAYLIIRVVHSHNALEDGGADASRPPRSHLLLVQAAREER